MASPSSSRGPRSGHASQPRGQHMGGFHDGKRSSRQQGNSPKAPSQQLLLPTAPIFGSCCSHTPRVVNTLKHPSPKLEENPTQRGCASTGCQIRSPKAPPPPCPRQDRGLRGSPWTLPSTGEEHRIPLCRDGDDPLSVKSLFTGGIIIIIIVKVEKPKEPDVGPVQLCFPWERINKLWQA